MDKFLAEMSTPHTLHLHPECEDGDDDEHEDEGVLDGLQASDDSLETLPVSYMLGEYIFLENELQQPFGLIGFK